MPNDHMSTAVVYFKFCSINFSFFACVFILSTRALIFSARVLIFSARVLDFSAASFAIIALASSSSLSSYSSSSSSSSSSTFSSSVSSASSASFVSDGLESHRPYVISGASNGIVVTSSRNSMQQSDILYEFEKSIIIYFVPSVIIFFNFKSRCKILCLCNKLNPDVISNKNCSNVSMCRSFFASTDSYRLKYILTNVLRETDIFSAHSGSIGPKLTTVILTMLSVINGLK